MDLNIFIFVFGKNVEPKYICIPICQKMSTQIYLYSYFGLKIVFVTHWLLLKQFLLLLDVTLELSWLLSFVFHGVLVIWYKMCYRYFFPFPVSVLVAIYSVNLYNLCMLGQVIIHILTKLLLSDYFG